MSNKLKGKTIMGNEAYVFEMRSNISSQKVNKNATFEIVLTTGNILGGISKMKLLGRGAKKTVFFTRDLAVLSHPICQSVCPPQANT